MEPKNSASLLDPLDFSLIIHFFKTKKSLMSNREQVQPGISYQKKWIYRKFEEILNKTICKSRDYILNEMFRAEVIDPEWKAIVWMRIYVT